MTPAPMTLPQGPNQRWSLDFLSDTLADGAKFSHTFAKAGKYPYHCSFHGDKGGKDMAGTVIVK